MKSATTLQKNRKSRLGNTFDANRSESRDLTFKYVGWALVRTYEIRAK